MQNNQVVQINIKKLVAGKEAISIDNVAVEEPLEIQLEYSTAAGRMRKNISVTMRTPGNDEELAAGFLFSEGIIRPEMVITAIRHLPADKNRILLILEENCRPMLQSSDRNFYSTSSCGICGKASIDAIQTSSCYTDVIDDICIKADLLYKLQDELRVRQEIFEETGGIHASAIFSLDGKFLMLREDVGRHNALDKIIGAALINKMLPLNNCILLLSGRASFELVQKAAMAGIKIIAAVGAPSSLAVEMAVDSGITLAGFLRNNRVNLYSGQHRIQP